MPVSSVTTDGTAFDLLTQVEARLRAEVAGLNAQNCFLCDTPIPPDSYFPTGKLACTVALMDGSFDAGHYDGGGANQLTEACSLAVTVLTRTTLDQPPRAREALLSTDRGILTKHKPAILRALLVDDINAEVLTPWHPLKGLNPILRGALLPRRCEGPRQISGIEWLGMTLWFEVEFDWDLR